MIDRNDVIAAYRLLLGREPESEAVIDHYATELANVQALRTLFINSPEFVEKIGEHIAPRAPKPAFVGPPMLVELDAAPEKMAQLFAKVSTQWHHLGKTEPHWSVLTNDSYVQENFAANREAFYASGETELKAFDAVLARAGIAREGLRRCIELGCGVGRATLALASRFEQVLGLDISAAHLQVARAHLKDLGADDIELRHLNHIDALATLGAYDLLYSRIVLQHNAPPVMLRVLDHLLAQLRPGGVAYFQVPTYKAGYRFRVDDYLQIHNETDMELHFLPQPALFDLLARHQCRLLELREDDAIGLSVTAVSNTVLVQKAS